MSSIRIARYTGIQREQTEYGGWEEVPYEYEAPMQEWEFTPATYDTSYTIGGAIPIDKYIDITFPELDLWIESPYNQVRYKAKISYNGNHTNWLDIQSNYLNNGVFTVLNIRTNRLNLDFSMIGNLSAGIYTANIIIEAYGVEDNVEHYIESRSVPVTLRVSGDSGGNPPVQSVPTDKEVYNLRYNKSTKILSGDTKIQVFSVNDVYVIQNRWPFNLGATLSNIADQRKEYDLFVITEDDEINENWFDANTSLINKALGNYSERVLIHANGTKKYITLNVEVYENTQDFRISQTSFHYLVMKNPSETKAESVRIENPNNMQISILAKPSFVESVEIVNNSLRFSTTPSSSLGLGTYEGEIVLSSGSVTRKIAITIKVVQALQSDFQNQRYYFTLDKNKISMEKTNPNAAYVKVQLQMYFNGFGREHREVQSYDYPYFGGKVEIFPGEEIQDFFIKCKTLDTLQNPNFNYSLAVVQIKITEHRDNDEQLSEFHIKNLLFAPGRKPKCFPIFTDHRVRGTIPDSIIRVSVDTFRPTSELSHLNTLYSNPFAPLPAKAEVHTFSYQRKNFRNDLENSIITTGQLEWIPLPKYKNPIHIFWENQNLVFDWLTASSRNEKSIEYEHLTNTDDEQSEKYGTKKRKILTLNTGWLLREEIDVVDDIIASRVCFIQIGSKTIKAYPISKKNELWDSEEHLFQTDLEFNILED